MKEEEKEDRSLQEGVKLLPAEEIRSTVILILILVVLGLCLPNKGGADEVSSGLSAFLCKEGVSETDGGLKFYE